jgi:hypothetical protein
MNGVNPINFFYQEISETIDLKVSFITKGVFFLLKKSAKIVADDNLECEYFKKKIVV